MYCETAYNQLLTFHHHPSVTIHYSVLACYTSSQWCFHTFLTNHPVQHTLRPLAFNTIPPFQSHCFHDIAQLHHHLPVTIHYSVFPCYTPSHWVIHVVKDISLLSVDENHHTRHHLFCKLDWHHLSLVPPLTSEVSYPASDSKWQYQLPYINLLYSDSLLVAFALLYSLLCHTQWIVNFASPYPSGDPLRETRPQNLLRVCHCDESLLFDLACIDPTYLLIIFPWLAGQDDIPDLIWFDDEMPPLGETLADCGSSRRGMVSEQ